MIINTFFKLFSISWIILYLPQPTYEGVTGVDRCSFHGVPPGPYRYRLDWRGLCNDKGGCNDIMTIKRIECGTQANENWQCWQTSNLPDGQCSWQADFTHSDVGCIGKTLASLGNNVPTVKACDSIVRHA